MKAKKAVRKLENLAERLQDVIGGFEGAEKSTTDLLRAAHDALTRGIRTVQTADSSAPSKKPEKGKRKSAKAKTGATKKTAATVA